MKRTLTACAAALSLVLSSVTPVQADGLDRDDVGKVLLGLVAIAAVGAAIENNRNERTEERRANSSRNDSWADLNRPQPRHDNRPRNRRAVLPAECLRTVDTRFGDLRLFERRCMDRNYRFVSDLPERCEVRVFTNRGPRNGFDPLCLREQGYRTNRRH